jgi:hypothetical protein
MSWSHLSWGAMAEVAIGVALLAAAVWFYRRPAPATEEGHGSYGSQGAVILAVIAAILLIHGLGGLEYHPSDAEIEAYQAQSR